MMPMSARACVTRKTLPSRLRSLAAVHPVGRLLRDAADGRFPPVDGGWHRVPQWRPGLSAVLAFTGHAVFAVDDRVSDETWTTLAKGLDTKQLLDVLIAVGGYRATSMAINSAGVQLDANMADFRFPPALR